MRIRLTFDIRENLESYDDSFEEVHSENWKGEKPTQSEMAKSIEDECGSWLNDLGIHFTSDRNGVGTLVKHMVDDEEKIIN